MSTAVDVKTKWILKDGMHFISVRDCYWATCCDENRATEFNTREEALAAARMTGELSARSMTPVEVPAR